MGVSLRGCEIGDSFNGWVVRVNSDKNEGRGMQVVLAVCEIRATAERAARKADVQGADGSVVMNSAEGGRRE